MAFTTRVPREREAQRRELDAQLAEVRGGLTSCGYHLRAFYGRLGYRVGSDGRPEPRGTPTW